MSCKLGGKITSVSVNMNFGAKMSILCEKNWNFGGNVDFSLSVHYYWKWLSFCKMCLFFFYKKWLLVSNSDKKLQFLRIYTLTKCQILIKNFNFLGCVNLYMC